jgi:5-formyltetrahydrofolate cyclo-ligase
MPQSERMARSDAARKLVEGQRVWKEAASILFYAPQEGELDVWPLLLDAVRQGREAYLPRFVEVPGGGGETSGEYVVCRIRDVEGDIGTGRYGIREPVQACIRGQLNCLDLTLVPGIAFDVRGCRLGRGKGYYDRLLAGVSGTTCGVAFDEQIVESIPVEPHDIRLNCILTPTRWIEIQTARGS